MPIRKEILTRFTILYWMVFLFALGVIARIVFLQFAEGDKWKERAMVLSQKEFTIQPNRGDICDSDGKTICSSVPFYEIRMDMKAEGITDKVFYDNIDSLSLCLADFFKNKTKQQYKKELSNARKNKERYFLIKKNVPYTDFKTIKLFPIFRMGQNRGGFIAKPTYKRVKPFNVLASRTIGYVMENESGEKSGYLGIESAFDHELRGVKGIKLMKKVPGNQWMPVNDANEIEPKDGRDIITTIDVVIQDVAETSLMKQLEECQADWGCVVLMEVETGEIKAMANLQRDSSGRYGEYFNHAIGSSVDPGSIFKLPSLVVALEDGYIDLDSLVNTEGGVKLYHDKPMRDSHKGGYGVITVKQVFEKSSNVGVSKIITKYYEKQPQRFIDRLYSMKLNTPLGLDIPGEARPVIISPKSKFWSGITLPWMSVGYSVRITPLQMLTFYNAIANNGKMVKPRFVKAIRENGKIIKTFEPEILHPSICSQQTIKKAKKMLEGVVERGTATNLKNDHIKIAGKTGTAQIANDKEGYGSTGNRSYRASFCGYFPAENPKYTCIVMINNPRGIVYYGGSLSGPVFEEIAELVYAKSLDIHTTCKTKYYLTKDEMPDVKAGDKNLLKTVCKKLMFKIVPDNAGAEWVSAKVENSKIICMPEFMPKSKNAAPNVIGMGLSDAIYLLEQYGLKVKTSGRGMVAFQSIEPGQFISKNDTIKLSLL